MSEKSERDETSSPAEKLLIDDLSNFQFHAAYLTYSEIYDKTNDLQAKERLNQNITALKQNQIDYSTFYRNVSQYRLESGAQYRYSRPLIRTQKKRDWRRETQKQERIKRHKR